jgi:hypothetical protein
MKYLAFLVLPVIMAVAVNTPPFAKSGADSVVAVQQEEADRTTVYYRFRTLINEAAYIPAQCYTKTKDNNGIVHNPCYACHTRSKRPNYINDPDFQVVYDFSEQSRKNRWANLFKDRRSHGASVSDEAMTDYIRTSNYFDQSGKLVLSDKLENDLPAAWDFDKNGRWDGVVPDLWYNFDAEGFDRDDKGRYTGWRAFAYYPFLGTFWPANGSTDDVLIRLPEVYQQDGDGNYNHDVYKANLAIVEAMVREQDIQIEPVEENALGNVDLDKNGEIGTADRVVYDWAPLKQRFMWYVGRAKSLQQEGEINIAAGLYPAGTEFLHSVRYIDFDDEGKVILSKRIKELRYARKRAWLNYSKLKDRADNEFKEKRDFPNRLRTVLGNHEVGVSNGQGWTYAAFIEDVTGDLRPQTYEELVFCVGCHGGVGATSDGIFSFERKLGFDAYRHGWYHWSQHSIQGLGDPLRADGRHEYAFYLEQNKAGDEFRGNTEIMNKFFDADGKLKKDQLGLMQNDISELLWPSKERAAMLNKAYKAIVEEQSFIHGRDSTVKPVDNVYRSLEEGQLTGIELPVFAEKLTLRNTAKGMSAITK